MTVCSDFSYVSPIKNRLRGAQAVNALGGDIKIAAFTHFTKGEGLEKRNEDFAAEVAAAIKG